MTRRRKRTKTRRSGVPCPTCGSVASFVVRNNQRGDVLQRVRRCSGCDRKFFTWESVRKNETDIASLATDVADLFRAHGIMPKSFLSHDTNG